MNNLGTFRDRTQRHVALSDQRGRNPGGCGLLHVGERVVGAGGERNQRRVEPTLRERPVGAVAAECDDRGSALECLRRGAGVGSGSRGFDVEGSRRNARLLGGARDDVV